MKLPYITLWLSVAVAISACGQSTTSQPVSGSPAASSSSGAGTVGTSDWVAYRPANAGFEVMVPHQPTEVSTTPKSSDWATPLHEAIVLEPGAKTGFSVSWIDFDQAALTGKSLDTILARGQAAQLARVPGGTIVEQRQIDLGGHPGRAWTVTFGGGSAQTRAYIVGARLYTLQAVLASGDEARGKAFLDSFKLTT